MAITNKNGMEDAIPDRVTVPAGIAERPHKLTALSEGLQRWLLGLNLEADWNNLKIATEYRKPTPERPRGAVVVHLEHSTTHKFSFLVEQDV